jgi:hypothetical protein
MTASFGAVTFSGDEEPVTDTGWGQPKATADVSLPLGAAAESIVTMGIGSRRRVIEMYLTPARAGLLEATVNTQATLTDWEAVPVTQVAFLEGCEIVEAVTGSYGTTAATRRVRLSFIAR